jgi:hypothetical protein
LKDIRAILKPPRNVTASAKGYKDPGLNPFVHEHLEAMRMFLSDFCSCELDEKAMH